MQSKIQKNNLPPVLIVLIEIRYLWQKGNNFVQSCLKIEDLDTKVVLSTLAIELLVKSIIGAEICIQSFNKSELYIKNKIDKEFRKIGHDFIKLFNSSPDLKIEMNIESIKKENGMGIIDDYRIKLKNNNFPLIFKTLEGSRYGAFAFKKDVMILANRTKEDKFLKELSQITSEKIRLAFKQLEN